MPLRAIINNEDVIAPLLSENEWDALKQRVKTKKLDVRLACCDNRAYLRTSKYGIQHFVHRKRGDCTSQPETWQHLKAKQEILRACRDAGYEASTEVQDNNWRADVLAQKVLKDKDKVIRIAFEVQWSPQTWEETKNRQYKFKDDNVRGCWFFQSPPIGYEVIKDVPLFRLEVTEDCCKVNFASQDYDEWTDGNDSEIALYDFIIALLGGRIKFCESIRTLTHQKIRIVFIEQECWRCHKTYHIYYMYPLETGCGRLVDVSGSLWDEFKYFFNPEILARIRKFAESYKEEIIRLAKIKKRYSKAVEKSYMSFGCPYCSAIYGDHFLHDIYRMISYYENKATAILETEINLSQPIVYKHPHWCFPENQVFCCK